MTSDPGGSSDDSFLEARSFTDICEKMKINEKQTFHSEQ